MKNLMLLSLLLLLAGCEKDGAVLTVTAPSAAPQTGSPTQAQPRLPTTKLFIGSQEIVAELATTPIQVETGMMWRTNMAEMEGMLFVFGRPHRAGFWMRNTLIPLSCAYIDSDGVIQEVHDMKPKDESSIEAQTDTIRYVLEMKQGWFERWQVKPGVVVKSEKGTLGQTFFGAR